MKNTNTLDSAINAYYDKLKKNKIEKKEENIDSEKSEDLNIQMINDETFNTFINSSKKILILVLAHWCPRSNNIRSNLHIMNDYSEYKIGILDFDSSPQAILELGGVNRPAHLMIIEYSTVKKSVQVRDYEELNKKLIEWKQKN